MKAIRNHIRRLLERMKQTNYVSSDEKNLEMLRSTASELESCAVALEANAAALEATASKLKSSNKQLSLAVSRLLSRSKRKKNSFPNDN